MNRNDCDIARDLMPLAIDGVCSEGSQRFLDAHTTACAPCKALYTRMKALPLPPIQPEPNQEAQALKRGLKYLGKRFKALWVALAALACAFVLLLAAAGIQQTLRFHSAPAPLDMYTVSIYRNDAYVSMGVSGQFYEQVYNGFRRYEERTILDDTGEEALILTYSVDWFPYQHKEFTDWNQVSAATPTPIPFKNKSNGTEDTVKELLNPKRDYAYKFTDMLETNRLCMDDGKLYMLAGWDSVVTTTGRTMLLANLGAPVYEIRVSDGKETRTIYTWGDEIDNYTVDMLDEYGLPQSGFLCPSDLEKYADLILP